MASGDGWAYCASGHRHWGRYGAAGLLLSDGARVILQHRAAWTHEGDTWGVPGGARNSEEDALAAALRESHEEAALPAAGVDPVGAYVDDHVGWSYTTVVARPVGVLTPFAANAESTSVRWHDSADVAGLALHSGFAAAWAHLRHVPATLYLMLSEQDAAGPLAAELCRAGVEAQRLPAAVDAGGLSRLFPHVLTPAASSPHGPAQVLELSAAELARLV